MGTVGASKITDADLRNYLAKFPFVLAPMASITNAPFRLLMKELGAGVVVSELISATGMQYGGQKTMELCRYFPGERPVGLQIFGEEPDVMAKAAQKLEQMGVDFVDINMGCPVPKVVRRGEGAALMKDPKAIYELLSFIKKSISIPLTVKIRTGWDSDSRNALECVHAAHEAGVCWVAIHGRTRAQGYEGNADWDFIADIKRQSPVPIIGNGDVLTGSQAVARLKDTGCDGIMIGRGALRNPFIFLEIRRLLNESFSPQYEPSYAMLFQRHLDLMDNHFNEFHKGMQLRKFMTWYSAGMEGASQFRKRLYTVEGSETEAMTKVIDLGHEFFGRPGLEKQHSYINDPFLQGGHG